MVQLNDNDMTTTNNIISKAFSILNNHDFYWMMDDYACTNGAMNRAKANMRYFVETINELPSDLYNLMKSLWMAEYNYCACFRSMRTSDKASQYKAEKERLYAEVESILTPIAVAA